MIISNDRITLAHLLAAKDDIHAAIGACATALEATPIHALLAPLAAQIATVAARVHAEAA